MSWRIRNATGADSAAAAGVVKAVFDEYGFTWEPDRYHADLYDLDAHYLKLGDRFWVAEGTTHVLATAGLEFFDRLPGEVGQTTLVNDSVRAAGSDCSFERLYVHPDARRRGLGAALFETAVNAAREAGRTAMEIWSDKQFGDAHRLYQRYGAVIVGDRVCQDDPDKAEEWGLVLKL